MIGLRPLRELGLSGLDAIPPLGLARDLAEAWRALAEAQREYQRLERELRAALTQVQLDALARLDQRVRETQDAGGAIAS